MPTVTKKIKLPPGMTIKDVDEGLRTIGREIKPPKKAKTA